MLRERAVMLVLWTLLGLFQAGATQEAHVVTSYTGGNGFGGSGVAQSQSIGPDGVTTGECAYTDSQGRSIKIRYREYPSGQIEAAADSSTVTNAVEELRKCRQTATVVSENVNQNVRQTQEQILRQQQQLQQEILRQQALFTQGNFPFVFPNPIPGNDFVRAGFGHP